MAGTGIVAGLSHVLIVNEQNLAVCLRHNGDAGIVIGSKGQLFSENAFWKEILQNGAGAVVFITDYRGFST